VTKDVIDALAVAGVVGQVLAALFALAVSAAAFGARGPFRWVRGALWGYELWAAFLVSSVATAGSLFFSEIAGFVPCELCWYQRICMYPLSLIDTLANTDKVSGTPTLFVGKTGTKGTLVNLSGPTDRASLVAAIKAAE
jgi:hypothetical protein